MSDPQYPWRKSSDNQGPLWYQRRWVQITVAVIGVLVVIGIVGSIIGEDEAPDSTPRQATTSGVAQNEDDSPASALAIGGAFGDGVHRVGADIQPGTYRNSDSASLCYWARLSGFGGGLDEIIANDVSDDIQIVTIRSSDSGFEASDCGVWTRIGN